MVGKAAVQEVRLVVGATLPRATRWMADELVKLTRDTISAQRSMSISFAGGATPRGLYELLASPLWRARVDWSKIVAFLSDERCVPPRDPRSNYRMIRESLLDRVLIAPRNVHPIPTESGDINKDSATYAATLTSLLPTGPGGVPKLDCVLLGLGPDGHAASLFPGNEEAISNTSLVTAVSPPFAPTPRITLTPRIFNAASHVFILTAGSLKAGALAGALAYDASVADHPVRSIAPVAGNLTFVTDVEACESLNDVKLRDDITTIRL